MNMNTLLTVLLIMVVLLMIAYNIQVTRIARLDSQIETLQQRQEAVIEENKRIMAARELVRDPQAIGEIAETQLGYELLGVDSILHLDVQQ